MIGKRPSSTTNLFAPGSPSQSHSNGWVTPDNTNPASATPPTTPMTPTAAPPVPASPPSPPPADDPMVKLFASIKEMEESASKKVANVLTALTDENVSRVNNLLKQLETAVSQKDRDVQYSLLEELLDIFGVEDVLPKVKIAGMESTGKSTLVEALLGLPISYSATGRATVAPVLIRLRKNKNLPDNMHHRCSLYHKQTGKRAENIPLHKVSLEMKDIMENIKSTLFFSFDPVELIIESNLPGTRSISFIDLPGVIATDTVHSDPNVQRANVEGLYKITELVIKSNIQNDMVVIIASMKAPPSHNNLYKRLNLSDQPRSNVIPVVTAFDVWSSTEAPRTSEKQKALDEWNQLFNNQWPYFLSLHQLPESFSSDPVQVLKEKVDGIAAQLVERERESKSFIEKQVPSMSDKVSFFMFSELKKEIQRRRDHVFNTNAAKVFSRIQDRVEDLRSLIADKKAELDSAKLTSVENILDDLLRFYSAGFKALYEGNPFSGSYDRTVYESTWDKEFSTIDLTKWPGTTSQKIVDKSIHLKEEIDEKFLANHTHRAHQPSCIGYQRMERLKSYLGLKVTSIELTNPSDSFISYNIATGPGSNDHAMVETAIGKMVALVTKKIFTDDASGYITHLLEHILLKHAEFSLTALTHSGARDHRQIAQYLQENPQFSAAFLRHVHKVIKDILVTEPVLQLQRVCTLMQSSVRFKTAVDIETMGLFISGSKDTAQRYNAKKRVEALDGAREIMADDVVLSNASVLVAGDAAKVCSLFQRHFSISRELFRINLNAIIDSLNQKIIGTLDNEEFSSALSRQVKTRKENGRLIPRDSVELQKEFHWINMEEVLAKQLKTLSTELTTLETINQQLSSLTNRVYSNAV